VFVRKTVNRITLGVFLGLILGVIGVILMLPLKFSDKTTALIGAFANRFAVGFLAVNVSLPLRPYLAGAIVGLLVSLPDAIITKAYAPILILGVLFGALAGLAGHAWAA
jgi:hypothetical protein